MILYDWKIALTYKDCHARRSVQACAATHLPNIVFNWFRQSQCNKFSVEDAPRSASPSTSLTQQTIDAL